MRWLYGVEKIELIEDNYNHQLLAIAFYFTPPPFSRATSKRRIVILVYIYRFLKVYILLW